MREAEIMYQRALKGYEDALGPKHTMTLSVLENLENLNDTANLPAHR